LRSNNTHSNYPHLLPLFAICFLHSSRQSDFRKTSLLVTVTETQRSHTHFPNHKLSSHLVCLPNSEIQETSLRSLLVTAANAQKNRIHTSNTSPYDIISDPSLALPHLGLNTSKSHHTSYLNSSDNSRIQETHLELASHTVRSNIHSFLDNMLVCLPLSGKEINSFAYLGTIQSSKHHLAAALPPQKRKARKKTNLLQSALQRFSVATQLPNTLRILLLIRYVLLTIFM
jgi:hypothetical protein